MIIKELTNEEYGHIAQKYDLPFQNQVSMRDLKEKNGWQVKLLAIYDNAELAALTFLNLRDVKVAGIYAECNYGPYIIDIETTSVTQILESLKKYLDTQNVTFFSCNPAIIKKLYDAKGNIIEDYSKILSKAQSSFQEVGFTQKDLAISTNGQWDMRWLFIKPLAEITSQNLIKSFSSQGKRHTKKALKNMLSIEEITNLEKPEFFEFKKLMEESAQKQGFLDRPVQYYYDIKAALGDKAKLMIVKLNIENQIKSNEEEIKSTHHQIKKLEAKDEVNQVAQLQSKIARLTEENNQLNNLYTKENINELVLSAGLFIDNNFEMIYLFGGNNSAYQQFASSYYLQYEMMNQAIKQNMKYYNFYGIEGAFDGSDSVLKFKQGFDGQIIEYIGTFTLVLQKKKYNMYKLAKKIKALIKR